MTASRSVTSIDLWCAIARDPLRVSPTTSVRDAIARMKAAEVSCVLVVEDSHTQDGRLLGLLTESDLVSLYLQPTPLHQVTVQAVVKPPIVQLTESQLGDIAGVLRLFGQHPTGHLPIVDERDRPVGLLTQAALSKLLVEDILGNPTPSLSSEKNRLSMADEAKIAHPACCQAPQTVEAAQDPSEIQALLAKQNAELLESNEQLQETLEELRVAEEALRQQNLCLEDERQKYSDLFNFAPDGYLTTNLSGVIESANQAIAFQLGVKSDDLIGKPLVVFILPGDHASFYNQLGQRWSQEHRRTQEITFQPREGKRFVAEVTLAPIYDHSHAVIGLRWLVRDISDRKAAERALKQTESQNNAVLAAIPDMMFRVGADGVYRQFMTPHREIDVVPQSYNPLGQWMHDFLPPDLAQRQQWALEQALQTGELLIYEQTVQVGDRCQDEEVRVIKCGDDEVLFMVRDITERKQTETALQQSEKTNRAILNAIPDLLIRMDRTGKYHSILAGTNIRIKRPSSVISQPTVYDVMPPDQAEQRLAYARRALETGTLQVYEQRFDVNGTLQDEEVRLTPLNDQEVLVIIRNISDRKQAERELQTLNQTLEAKIAERTALLQASEASKRAIIAALPDLLLRVNRDGTCLEYIPPVQKDEWCTRVEHHLSEVLPPDSLQRELAAIALALDTGKLQVYELDYIQGDRHIFEEVRVSPITADEALLIVRNVGDRKQAEAQLQAINSQLIRSNDELAQANRFKDEFLSTISHELRTPLNAVLGLAEGLQEQVFGDINPNQRKALATIRRSGTHLLNIINDILDLTNLSTGQLTLTRVPTSVSMLCQTCIDLVQPLIQEKRIQVEIQIQPNLPNLDIDGQRIQQVLVNLLSNAVKFTAAGGRVSLTANVRVRGSAAGNEGDRHPYLHLEIADTGIGIAPEELSRLFQPFTQVDSALNRQHEGTGLGLAIVQRIVELHGGTVSVHSTVGIGSRFTVNLPLNRQLMPFANPTADFQREPMQTTANVAAIAPLILLAEDNEANIITIASYLEAKGYRLVVAKDGQAAVDCAKAHHPDLILMDVQMPVLDGLDATQQIRCDPNLLTVPIIALTALAMPNDRQICLDAGADEYLSKPVRLKELIQMIQRLLANAAANSAHS